jgi:lipopolysaccharide heptosyltransferase I
MTRLLVVRLGSLGDLVHTLPAVAALHRAHPDADIDWLVDAVHRPFLELVPILSSIVELRDRGVRGWLEARRTLRRRHYDVAVDFQGLLKSAALGRLSGAQRVVGFDRAAAREGAAAAFYGQRVAVADDQHVIRKNLALAAALGASGDALEFPIRTVTSPAIAAVIADIGSPYAVLNTGAAWPNKRWPAARLGAVATHLRERHGLSSVILWGPGEGDAARAAVDASAGAARMAPEIGLADLTALVAGARLMLSGDTGPTHIAAALGVPIVALFGPTNPRRNGPWDDADVVLSRYDACDCHYERRCRRDDADWCLGAITVDEVVAAVDERLRRARALA